MERHVGLDIVPDTGLISVYEQEIYALSTVRNLVRPEKLFSRAELPITRPTNHKERHIVI